MEFTQAVQARRSIRKFTQDPVSSENLQALLETARLAPSGSNLQPTRYILLESQEARKQLSSCTPLPFVSQAPLVIAVCVDLGSHQSASLRTSELREAGAFVDTPLQNQDSQDLKAYTKNRSALDPAVMKAYLSLNAAIAIDHLTLKAVELGLGSCWVMMFDKDKTRQVLGLEERYEVVALLPIGTPAQDPAPRPRLALEELVLKHL